MTIWLRQLLNRLRSSFPSVSRDGELDSEMASHLEFATEENMKGGMSREDARRQALIKFGGLEQAKAKQHQARGFRGLDILWLDLRHTFRTMRRDPVFTLVAVLILTLGIGANIAVFSVVNTILLRPLPFHDPQQLVWISDTKGNIGLSGQTYSVDAYQEFRERSTAFQNLSGYFAFDTPDNAKLLGRGEPRPVTDLNVIGNFFQTLGVEPALGRLFTAEECRKGGPGAVLLSYPFWKRQFNGDPNIVGQTLNFATENLTVVGVLPESFDFGSVFAPGSKVDAFTPAILENMQDWGNTLALVGRLKAGVSVSQAQAQANIIVPKLLFNEKHPDWGGGYRARLLSLKDYVSGKLSRSLIVLWCAVGLILLIVCVNLSNLLLARAAARSKEFAMRNALGAQKSRLVRQLLTESLVLSAMGAVFGLGLAYAVTAYLARQGAIALPLISTIRLDPVALAWTLLITIATAMIFGLVPALKMAQGNLLEALKHSSQGMSEGKKHETLRSVLVISELALACVLLVGAGLLLHSFLRVIDVDLGFEPARAAAVKIDYNDGADQTRRAAIMQEIVQRIDAVPGIETAAITDNLPLDMNRSWGMEPADQPVKQSEFPTGFVYVVSPGYLRTMAIRMVAGRDFSWNDNIKSQKVAVINQTAARRLWPGENPLGRKLRLANGTEIVGVVADVHESSLEKSPGPQMYLPIMQFDPAGARLVVRTVLDPGVLASSVIAVLRQINPSQPANEFRTIQGIVDHSTSPRRFFVYLVGIFAALGLVLASLGIYGVISYSVTRQTQEIGIRMALGASASNVQFRVIAKTLRLALIGVFLGAAASLAVAHGIASLLFAVTPNDPPTFTGTILVLTVVAVLAGYLPARRASRIDPMIALRNN